MNHNPLPLVTLTTDFGTRDPYVASMKGVLYSECPGVFVVDLSHEIAPHHILEGALFLAGATRHFPMGTIHVAVVDPGVGTDRSPIVCSLGGFLFVCPDNGLMTLLARSMPATEIRTIASSGPSSGRVSATFHGRDIFAPAAARLACGLPLRSIGPEQTSLVEIPIPGPSRNPSGGIQGQVIHVDRFGNLITNISRGFVEEERPAGPPREALIGDGKRIGLRDHYGEVPKGEPLALWGSSDLLELAANQGHAAKLLGLTVGAGVTLRVVPPAKGQGSM